MQLNSLIVCKKEVRLKGKKSLKHNAGKDKREIKYSLPELYYIYLHTPLLIEKSSYFTCTLICFVIKETN
jgi:hypothetical protein